MQQVRGNSDKRRDMILTLAQIQLLRPRRCPLPPAQRFFWVGNAAGRTRWIVDLQVDGGGFLVLGHERFRWLMPGIAPGSVPRCRLDSGLLQASGVFAVSVAGGGRRANRDTANDTQSQKSENFDQHKLDLDIPDSALPTYGAKFKRQMGQGDSFRSLIRGDMSDNWWLAIPLVVLESTTLGTGTVCGRSRRRTS
ncbi:hypothetical protein BJ875DRAFT_465722 [Amylocarpus encephaloides]|uniref:Uncharacterized protein n=1 Tax=Amylocarpus encephaloides TaxID=45428 RepID=A0A9P7YG19_9HELO|nr:hypothetical protein BJ875DRAFT_465722 [Amylocarpus encephaloides]